MASEAVHDRDNEAIQSLLHRLRPGDQIRVTNNQQWNEENNGSRKMWVWKIANEEGPHYPGEYYRIYAHGPVQRNQSESGCYVLMPDKPDGKGSSDPPEVFHRTPNQAAEYRETTKGAIMELQLQA